MDTTELTRSELDLLSPHEKAGLVSHIACHFCGLKFDVRKTRSLRSHIEEVHVLGNTGYMCGICCEEFTSRKFVETHMSTFHRAPKPLGCGICGETFRVRNLLLKHLNSHPKEEIDKNNVGLCYCGECFEFFNSVMSLQIHSMTHREQPMFVCGACGLQTQHRHVMIKHLETHVITNLLNADSKKAVVHEQKSVEVNPALTEVDLAQAKDVYVTAASIKDEEQQDQFYRCGVCFASFESLSEAMQHAESPQGCSCQDESQVEKDSCTGTIALNVLMQSQDIGQVVETQPE